MPKKAGGSLLWLLTDTCGSIHPISVGCGQGWLSCSQRMGASPLPPPSCFSPKPSRAWILERKAVDKLVSQLCLQHSAQRTEAWCRCHQTTRVGLPAESWGPSQAHSGLQGWQELKVSSDRPSGCPKNHKHPGMQNHKQIFSLRA